MTSKTDIVNLALRAVGAGRIDDLDTDTAQEAIVARDLYDNVLDDMLRSHNWNFATRRKKLAQKDNVPTFAFDHAYAAPDDWIRTVDLFNNDGGDVTGVTYSEEIQDGVRVFLASTEDVWLEYVARITDPNMMSGDFVMAFAERLAKEFAIPLANSNTVYQLKEKSADRALMRAKSTDSRGSTPKKRPVGTWASARMGWR